MMQRRISVKAGSLVAVFVAVCAIAQDQGSQNSRVATKNGPDSVSGTTLAVENTNCPKDHTAEKRPSKPAAFNGVQDVLKMTDAGVSKEVIKTYVENAQS